MGLLKQESKIGIKEKIIQYLTKGDIVLHADEERMLDRWTFVDTQLRLRKYTRAEITSMVVKRFGVSKFTAERDISNAHYIFGNSRQLSKKYLLVHHIEEIELLIQRAKTDPVLLPFLPKLLDTFTKAVCALPEDVANGETTPTMLQFVLNGGNIETGMTVDQAMELAKRYMKRKAYAEDLDFDAIQNAEIDYGE